MRGRILVSVVLSFVLGTAGPPRAEAQDRRALVVATIGPRAITLGELEDRLAAVPKFQLYALAGRSDDARRKFLDDVMIPEVLLALGAEKEKLEQAQPTAYELERALAQATLRAERDKQGPARGVPIAEVNAYYQAHLAEYVTKDRLGIYRIRCKSKDEAAAVLDVVTKEPKAKLEETWKRLAREKSLDKGTYLRGGNLGFVDAEGASNEPGVRVVSALFTAAASVKDGEIVPAPVAEETNFSVVWRRSSVPSAHRSLDDASSQIRAILWKKKTEETEARLKKALRDAHLTDVDENAIYGFTIAGLNGSIAPRGKAGQVPPKK